ncbi:MarR family transcriptional regulator [Roseibium sp. TrichSKD4]|nr:MarR family transcriptional regulator [Roseibium sp. TrichSKD4]
MSSERNSRIRELLDRLLRLHASEDWSEPLNPAQSSALNYLVRANRFSRSPSNVADYLCTTRGTASQTLKALEKKGFIEKASAAGDKRSLSYNVTKMGLLFVQKTSTLDDSLNQIDDATKSSLETGLTDLIRHQLTARNFKSFGICNTCKHHRVDAGQRTCQLLQVPLKSDEGNQLCHEHSAR